MSERPILVAAGGTGGHLFPAAALSEVLRARGLTVDLVTDERTTKYTDSFPARTIHKIASATPSGRSPLVKITAGFTLAGGFIAAYRLVKELQPSCVIGFGGYPTVPPVLAASLLRVPIILHEANAVIGRANHFLSGRAMLIAKGFEGLKGLAPKLDARTRLTGNPVRPAVLEAAARAFPDFDNGKIRLLVTGGSQGARVMSDVVPAAIALLPEDLARRLVIVQQARAEDCSRVSEIYQRLGIEVEVAPFFADLPQRIAQSHLVISRAGASTVSELAVIGRPSILVPFPHALDQDQSANAAHLSESGAATVVQQARFTPQWLASTLTEALNDPGDLVCRAELAKRAAITDAAERLADLVQALTVEGEKNS